MIIKSKWDTYSEFVALLAGLSHQKKNTIDTVLRYVTSLLSLSLCQLHSKACNNEWMIRLRAPTGQRASIYVFILSELQGSQRDVILTNTFNLPPTF